MEHATNDSTCAVSQTLTESNCSDELLTGSRDRFDLPLQEASFEILQKKYLAEGESTVGQKNLRVAIGLAQAEENPEAWVQKFVDLQRSGYVLAGRIQANAGLDTELLEKDQRLGHIAQALRVLNNGQLPVLSTTMLNCYVHEMADTLHGEIDGTPGIMDCMSLAAKTLQAGGGVGYDADRIRPLNAFVSGVCSTASGPMPFLDALNAMCNTIMSAGGRRGAQMVMMSASHPNIIDFVTAKRNEDRLRQFNMSVKITDDFMRIMAEDGDWELVHPARPHPDHYPDAHQRDDGQWVYQTIKAIDLWNEIMRGTYDWAEPGVWFVDRVNRENNNWYCEDLRTTNPCGEIPLPNNGCCCLGSWNLTQFVREPFTNGAYFDFAALEQLVPIAVRMQDNVLDVAQFPHESQRQEAQAKRRLGMGFLGLGSALVMLGIKYNSPEGLAITEEISQRKAHAEYRASIELAEEKGAFPALDRDKYLRSGFARRLPKDIRKGIKKHGIRNSHLGAIAPTGTIALSLANNATNGIEPIFSVEYERNVKQDDGSKKIVKVRDYAYLLFRKMFGEDAELTDAFVTVCNGDLAVEDHLATMERVQPYIDSSISKTVNIPTDYSFEQFKSVYQAAFDANLKSITTFRFIPGRESVIVDPNAQPVEENDTDRRMTINPTNVVEETLRWPDRPATSAGANGVTFPIDTNAGSFYLTVNEYRNGITRPLEIFAVGDHTPRGIGAIAKLLSVDMWTFDKGWLKLKLKTLAKTCAEAVSFTTPSGMSVQASSACAAMATLIRERAKAIGYFVDEESETDSPMLSALSSPKEPKTNGDGAVGLTIDIRNANSGDDFLMTVKEVRLPNGQILPYSVWLSQGAPVEFAGLCMLLSLDMRISDLRWVALKLKKLINFSERGGEFFAHVPGTDRQTLYPSTIAYMATVLRARYQALGLFDADGNPVDQAGLFASTVADELTAKPFNPTVLGGGLECPACAGRTLYREGGCQRCVAPSCGFIGDCG